MKKLLPPLSWLRTFEASARHLSFTSAAEEIGLTQSAVSQQVKSLETRIGVPLFMRNARGLALTDAGRRLLPEIAAPLNALANAVEHFDTGPTVNLLTVAASISVVQWIIAPSLPDFISGSPSTRVRLLSAIWPDDFHSTRADVEIRFGSAQQAGPNAIPLQPSRLIAVKAPNLAGDLQELPLIEAVGTSSGWQAWRKEFGDVPEPMIYTDTYGMALQLAANGNGVALVSELLAKHALETGSVVRADPNSIQSAEGYHLSIDDKKPEAIRFREWLLGAPET